MKKFWSKVLSIAFVLVGVVILYYTFDPTLGEYPFPKMGYVAHGVVTALAFFYVGLRGSVRWNS